MTAQSAHPVAPASIGDLVRRAAAERPDELAVVDSAVRWSWGQLEATVSGLAAGLASYGLQVGDRIAIQAPTSADFLAVYLASLQAGLVVVPVNPGYTIPELSHILSDSGARVLVTSSVAAVGAAAQLRAEHPALERIVVAARSGNDEVPTVNQLLNAGSGQPPVRRDRSGEDLAVLLYTSGTSGRPKGAMLPVRALLANLEQFGELSPTPISSTDRVFLPLPMFHIFGLNAGLGMALYFGASIVLASRFHAEDTLQTMVDEQITVVVGAPAEFAAWADQPSFRAGFAGVRFALSGSAPLVADLVARYTEVGVGLYEGYGLTEAAPVVTVNLAPAANAAAANAAADAPAPDAPASDAPASDSGWISGWIEPKAGSVGRPLPGVEVRLLDTDGTPVEPGDLGLLEVRGANLFTGYWPDGHDGPDSEGWFATGDLAVADDDGDYYLIGRRGDLVLVNGFNVYPAEVEAVLAKLAGVREVAVLGLPDTADTELVVAYVVPEPGVAFDAEDLLSQAAGSLARFKLPKRIIEVDTLPHTATGKVMKWQLRSSGAGRHTSPDAPESADKQAEQ
ncbi:MAG TPA: AMP-binding protein [Jatrophihabitans sp.]